MKSKVSEIIRQVAVDNPTEMVSPARLKIGDRLSLYQFIEKEEGDPRQMGFLEMNHDILFPSYMQDNSLRSGPRNSNRAALNSHRLVIDLVARHNTRPFAT